MVDHADPHPTRAAVPTAPPPLFDQDAAERRGARAPTHRERSATASRGATARPAGGVACRGSSRSCSSRPSRSPRPRSPASSGARARSRCPGCVGRTSDAAEHAGRSTGPRRSAVTPQAAPDPDGHGDRPVARRRRVDVGHHGAPRRVDRARPRSRFRAIAGRAVVDGAEAARRGRLLLRHARAAATATPFPPGNVISVTPARGHARRARRDGHRGAVEGPRAGAGPRRRRARSYRGRGRRARRRSTSRSKRGHDVVLQRRARRAGRDRTPPADRARARRTARR